MIQMNHDSIHSNSHRAYTQRLFNRLQRSILYKSCKEPHSGLIVCSLDFDSKIGFPTCEEVDFLCLATMLLLFEYGYPRLKGYSKFTVAPTIVTSSGSVTFTSGPAILLTSDDGLKFLPESDVYSSLYSSLVSILSKYGGIFVSSLCVRIYTVLKNENTTPIKVSDITDRLLSIIPRSVDISSISIVIPQRISHSKKKYQSEIITSIKHKRKMALKSFIVADIETVSDTPGEIHTAYAVGLMIVHPGDTISSSSKLNSIETYFSEDYFFLDSFSDRSTKVLFDFICRLSTIVKEYKSLRTIYFHNFGRFDGILLIRHLALNHPNYRIKPLFRNRILYELVVFEGKRVLFRFRDSLHLLPGSLENLSKNLCPELGSKGDINHDEVLTHNLSIKKTLLLDYLKQDILLLGGVLRRAQDVYWEAYKVDIECKMTISSLAMTIFRIHYYDERNWPIYIPPKTADTFIRRGYYGGHVDTYKPYGENVYIYDVNSLYPYIMKTFPMPSGKAKWHSNFVGKDLDELFGFIEAYVVCPETMNKPFLPFRSSNNDPLIFPTGMFIGVYYSEELKYARTLGYKVIPICGYLYEKKESPFDGFISSLFESRKKSQQNGNEALSFVYKTIMNSLYGRFGINPISTVTEVCLSNRYNYLFKKSSFLSSDMLNEKYHVVSYYNNTNKSTDYWTPPQFSAVQLSAAITACARIYMYPYISREDCYYTDTDSVVLGQPLPDEMISSSELGKFKLENKVLKGYFLAPKAYSFKGYDKEKPIIKYKGIVKKYLSSQWFEDQYLQMDKKIKTRFKVVSSFQRDLKNFQVYKHSFNVHVTLTHGKRLPIMDKKKRWVDTVPLNINKCNCVNKMSSIIINQLSLDLEKIQDQNLLLANMLKKARDNNKRLKKKKDGGSS